MLAWAKGLWTCRLHYIRAPWLHQPICPHPIPKDADLRPPIQQRHSVRPQLDFASDNGMHRLDSHPATEVTTFTSNPTLESSNKTTYRTVGGTIFTSNPITEVRGFHPSDDGTVTLYIPSVKDTMEDSTLISHPTMASVGMTTCRTTADSDFHSSRQRNPLV